ncbi:hypothetical protein [Daejeonella lutea]|uniref:Uncharacterized protein n=1 Tax=Daejeonella lutea TaxID=572036 RepID=A0A1T5A1L1_9SPHI|nr:hypothetical protein [Daejeonella lutea]SKB28911.1 hypothetical protein SAMN05661099_0216 [Daejeonella lutea]
MSKEQHRSDNRLKNVSAQEDASASKDADKLVEVRKTDTAEDSENDFVVHEQPFDEQMHEPDVRERNPSDEDAD